MITYTNSQTASHIPTAPYGHRRHGQDTNGDRKQSPPHLPAPELEPGAAADCRAGPAQPMERRRQELVRL